MLDVLPALDTALNRAISLRDSWLGGLVDSWNLLIHKL